VELKKSLGFWDVFSIALGQIIGSGILVLIGIGIGFTAYAIPFAIVLSAIFSIIKQLPVAFMGSAMPATGGLYVWAKGWLFLSRALACHLLSYCFIRIRIC
jgi:APA family basic amino acid/polyamine antiporter